jgi:hypothetical protein
MSMPGACAAGRRMVMLLGRVKADLGITRSCRGLGHLDAAVFASVSGICHLGDEDHTELGHLRARQHCRAPTVSRKYSALYG